MERLLPLAEEVVVLPDGTGEPMPQEQPEAQAIGLEPRAFPQLAAQSSAAKQAQVQEPQQARVEEVAQPQASLPQARWPASARLEAPQASAEEAQPQLPSSA